MGQLGFGLAAVALFGAAFGGTLWIAQPKGTTTASVAAADTVCNLAEEACRAQLRSEGERHLGAGRRERAIAAFRRAGVAGDGVSAFHLGWIHEEAYRAAVGSRLETTSPVAEEAAGVQGLPRGGVFEAMLARHEAVPTGAARAAADRSLAFLWYARSAAEGFAPAMNNIGAMYQFGEMGGRDLRRAKTWYQRASERGNPVAWSNVQVIRSKTDGNLDCESTAVGRQELQLGHVPAVIDLTDAVMERTRLRGRGLDFGQRAITREFVDLTQRMRVGQLDLDAATPRTIGLMFAIDQLKDRRFDDDDPEMWKPYIDRSDCAARLGGSTTDRDRAKLERLRDEQNSRGPALRPRL